MYKIIRYHFWFFPVYIYWISPKVINETCKIIVKKYSLLTRKKVYQQESTRQLFFQVMNMLSTTLYLQWLFYSLFINEMVYNNHFYQYHRENAWKTSISLTTKNNCIYLWDSCLTYKTYSLANKRRFTADRTAIVTEVCCWSSWFKYIWHCRTKLDCMTQRPLDHLDLS